MTSSPGNLFSDTRHADDFPDTINTAIQDLDDLTFRRYRLTVILNNELLQLETPNPILVESHRALAFTIEQHIQQIDVAAQGIISNEPDLDDWDQIIQSFPGADTHLSAALIIHAPQLGTSTNKQIASWLALNPNAPAQRVYDPNPTPRSIIRQALNHTTLRAIDVNPVIAEFYRGLVQRDKHEGIAINASTRKVLSTINSLIRKQQLWQQELAPINVPSNES